MSPHEVDVEGTRLRARNFVIATGTTAFVPPIPGVQEISYYTNETIFDEMTSAPDSLLILGGGPIGCELAQVMARLGVSVTVVELLPRLLPRDDPDAAENHHQAPHRRGCSRPHRIPPNQVREKKTGGSSLRLMARTNAKK